MVRESSSTKSHPSFLDIIIMIIIIVVNIIIIIIIIAIIILIRLDYVQNADLVHESSSTRSHLSSTPAQSILTNRESYMN